MLKFNSHVLLGTSPIQKKRTLEPLWFFLLAFYAVWTTWAALLVYFPAVFNGVYLRNAVRLVVWVLPTLAFVKYVEGPSVLTRLGFRPKAGRGIVSGIIVSLLLAPIFYFARHGFDLSKFVFPTAAVWIGPIITAPLAEEILFRGLVFRTLRERWRTTAGLLVSSVLFALIHLPYWWLSGAKSGADLWLALLEIAGIGALLCGLFRWTGSLWTPLIYHIVNNFVNSAFSQ